MLLLSCESVQQLLWVRMALLLLLGRSAKLLLLGRSSKLLGLGRPSKLLRRIPKLLLLGRSPKLLLRLGRPLANCCWSAGRLLRRWRDLLRSLWQP